MEKFFNSIGEIKVRVVCLSQCCYGKESVRGVYDPDVLFKEEEDYAEDLSQRETRDND